ncbi:histidine kinase [Paenibacillus qinlingensis]|uniref:Two-component system sensor histidine kinase YesM n=1 Tax=Paenibacillus qinlingensis TaxID=1837343 RepID=A0ABU1NQV8_9BACL|nr:histidine kinase [Paenibacillus qinlingensis]MDR6549848.1 two-component system sensor histidine kinase YesM [Paenibacillus qinlingensis]
MKKPTLRLRLLRSFLVILTPLVLFLYYENYYAIKIVREEVSQSTSNVLSIHITQIDRTLDEITHYLLQQIVTSDTKSAYLDMASLPETNGNYTLAKIKIHNELTSGSTAFENFHSFFAYSVKKEDFIFSRSSFTDTNDLKEMLGEYVREKVKGQSFSDWIVLRYWEKSYLVRVAQASDGVYIGAVLLLEDLIRPLRGLDYGDRWEAILLDTTGQPLTKSVMSPETMTAVNRKLVTNPLAFQVFENPADHKDYLLVSTDFKQAPLRLAAMIPEKSLLQRLPFFQGVIYLIPLGVIVIFIFYSHYLRKMLFSPMNSLIMGMRRVVKGDMEIGLKEAETEELNFLITTFNHMVSQISHLKINVYEEMLKAQQSEFKHLQAQINPHFYLNSLNIINSLSTLGENDLIKKMTEHLADYFRFITRSHRDTITIDEEVRHIRNYLEIQMLRFPEKITYNIDLPEPFSRTMILPLMIQPFVENAVIHGMEEGSKPFHIEISAGNCQEDPNCLEILIRDNGVGFTPEVLSTFNQKKFGDGTGTHMGIWNVYRRMRMAFGYQAEVTFLLGEPNGAIVRLTIPAIGAFHEMEEEEDGKADDR